MKTAVIYHHADFDGIFCREIARKALGEKADYIGWDYGEPTPQIEEGRPIVILDLSVPELMERPNLIWIDHHRTAIAQFEPMIEGLRIDGVAACRLAWQWFFGNREATKEDYLLRRVVEPLAVRLAGEYDIWDKRDPRVDVFQHGLRSRDLTPCWDALLSIGPMADRLIPLLLEAGQALEYSRTRENESLIRARSFSVKFEGLLFLALCTPRCNSMTFTAGLKPEHEGCLAFAWTGEKWRVSLYGVPHRPDVDLSAIATKYGGGGHKQACGFECEVLPFVQPSLGIKAEQLGESIKHLEQQIGTLGQILLEEFGGPQGNESACEMAARRLREQRDAFRRIRVKAHVAFGNGPELAAQDQNIVREIGEIAGEQLQPGAAATEAATA